jgi:hypothetical protein
MNFVFHPVLFAVYPILFLYANNYGKIPCSFLLLPVALAMIAALAVWFIIGLFVKEPGKPAFLTSLTMIFFFSYGHFSNLLAGINLAGFSFLRNRYRAAVYLLLFVISFILGIRSYSKLRGVNRILNLASLFLIILVTASIGWQALSGRPNHETEKNQTQTKIVSRACPDNPDIYYIILDGFARDDSLVSIYGRPCTGLTDHLKAKGFYVAKDSTSNYAMTVLSLGSSLNMDYLQAETGACPGRNVREYFGPRGYSFPDSNSGAISPDSFFMMLSNMTMLDMIAHRLNFYAGQVRSDVLEKFSWLESISRVSGPKFIFVRVPSPHPPYVFGRNGEAVNTLKMHIHGDIWKTSWDDKDAYLDQLIFISKKTEELVDSILSHSKPPPIIIIQADHGPQFSDEKNDFYRKRMAILNAYFVPKKVKKSLYPSITPVNSFRLILRDGFGVSLKLLPDRNYFSTMERPYEFIDVTDKISENR